MPFRFRRSLKILPGVKVDLSKGGLSTSIGGKGFHMNVGRRGVLPTVSLPGTGMSYTGDNLLASSPLSFNQNYPGQPKAQSDRPKPPPNYGANQGLPPRRKGGGNVTQILLIGGGILSSLCLLLLCSAVVLSRMNFAAPQPTLDYGAINTSVFGTALASKLSTLSVSTPMAQATATPIAATAARNGDGNPTSSNRRPIWHQRRRLHSDQSTTARQSRPSSRR